jgi:hypothetical protein
MKHEWIIRASQIGDLMTAGRKKEDLFGETANKKILEAVLLKKYGIEPKQDTNKYVEKGIENEKSAIEMAKDNYGWLFVDVDKIKPRLVNDFIAGEPDVLTDTVLADVKCSWDATTFHWTLKDGDCPNKAYFYQMQCYMWLTNRQEAELVYCLTDTPERLIYDETRREVWRTMSLPENAEKSEDELHEEIEERKRKQLTFGGVPKEKRTRRTIIKRDDAVIEEIKNRIIEARKIYDNLKATI